MTEEKDSSADEGATFLTRWSRRKHASRQVRRDRENAAADRDQAATYSDGPVASASRIPTLEGLDGDADYSVFLSEGVEESLRRLALRKLFSSAKFNVRDGLCEYDGDYTKFSPLGDWMVAKLRERRGALAHGHERRSRDTEAIPGAAHERDDAIEREIEAEAKESQDEGSL